MPATLKSITSKTNTVSIELDGDPKAITIEYSARRVTPRMLLAIQKGIADGSDPTGVDSTIQQFQAMVTKWDLRPDEHEPVISLTTDALQDVPLELLSNILGAIGDDMTPKEQTGGSSNTP